MHSYLSILCFLPFAVKAVQFYEGSTPLAERAAELSKTAVGEAFYHNIQRHRDAWDLDISRLKEGVDTHDSSTSSTQWQDMLSCSNWLKKSALPVKSGRSYDHFHWFIRRDPAYLYQGCQTMLSYTQLTKDEQNIFNETVSQPRAEWAAMIDAGGAPLIAAKGSCKTWNHSLLNIDAQLIHYKKTNAPYKRFLKTRKTVTPLFDSLKEKDPMFLSGACDFILTYA